MSACVRRGFDADGYSGDRDEDEEEDEEQTGDGDKILMEKNNERKKKKRKRRKGVSGFGYVDEVQTAKKEVLSPFRKFRRLFQNSASFSSTSSHRSSSVPRSGSDLPSGRTRRRRSGNLCCCYCLSPPKALENDNPSDKDDPSHSYEYLKSMIEKNDFYSKECNTHIDH